MKICVIGDKNDQSTLSIFESFKAIDKSEVLLAPLNNIKIGIEDGEEKILHKDIDLAGFDAIIPRFTGESVLFEYSIINALWKKMYIPISPTAVLMTSDKYLVLSMLKQANIPVPKSYLTLSPDSGKRIVKDIKSSVVMKLPGIEGGRGIIFAESENAAAIIDALNVLHQPIFIQKYVKSEDGSIKKAIVVGDEVVLSVKEIPSKEDKRTNVPFGKIKEYTMSEDTRKLAVRAAKAVGADICEIDIIGDQEKYVLEVNINPKINQFTDLTSMNLSDYIAGYVVKRIEKENEKSS